MISVAEAQTVTSATTTPAPAITKLSSASTTPGTWVSILGANLSRTQIFVDGKKVPLANLIFSDVLGKEVKYRVQDLAAGSHSLSVFDSATKLQSNSVSFTVNKTATSPAVAPLSPTLVKYVKVVGLDSGSIWRVGTEKAVTWLALGTGEIDILICSKTPVVCVQVANKTANDGSEVVKMPSTVKVGQSYAVVRKYKDDSVKGVSTNFNVATPSAFMRGRMQLASAWEAMQVFLTRIILGQ